MYATPPQKLEILKKLLIERLFKVILNGQNDDLLYEEDSFD